LLCSSKLWAWRYHEEELLRTYETVFVLSPELAPNEVTAQAAFYKDNIVKNGGEIITCDEWGKRELAYTIGSFKEAFYVLIQFKAEPAYIGELELRYKYNELILRHVVVMIDEKRFKLKPRKDPARRERRHDRRIEEGAVPEEITDGVTQDGVIQDGITQDISPEDVISEGITPESNEIISEDITTESISPESVAQEGIAPEDVVQESISSGKVSEQAEAPETSGMDTEETATSEAVIAAETTGTDENEPS
jgi:small subunit ribosomal protein S6